MAMIDVKVCSNCKKRRCDGKVYTINVGEFHDKPIYRRVCVGEDRENFLSGNRYQIVRGHGDVTIIELGEPE